MESKIADFAEPANHSMNTSGIDIDGPSPMARRVRLKAIAEHTVELNTEHTCAASFGFDPRAIEEWGFVAYVLSVKTIQVRNPVLVFVLMEANDFSFHDWRIVQIAAALNMKPDSRLVIKKLI
jgi:hypothetical protein